MNGAFAEDTLLAQTQATIRQIEQSDTADVCSAHPPLSSACVLLLRWQVAQFQNRQRRRWQGWRDTVVIVLVVLGAVRAAAAVLDLIP